MKLKRSALAHYIKPNTLSADYFLLGKDISSMAVEMNGSFETSTNILGETNVSDNGYAPTMTVDPYVANPDDSIYEFILDLAMNRKSGDDAKAELLEVVIEDTSAESHKAWKEDCIIEITSYGGESNVAIPFVVHPNGNRKQGTVKIVNKVPTWQE